MNKILRDLCFVGLILFSIVGFLIIENITHELTHKIDYHRVVEKDRLCALVIPTNLSNFYKIDEAIAFYQFYPKKGTENETETINSYSEKHAMAADIVVMVVFLFCLCVVIWDREIGRKGGENDRIQKG